MRLRFSLALATAVAGLLVFSPAAFATVTSSVSGDFLIASSDGSDAITVDCQGGNVKVNGADPGSGAATCHSIFGMEITGGPGSNVLDVLGVNATDFDEFGGAFISGGAGADTITGSPSDDSIDGGPGSDSIDGGDGFDSLSFDGTSGNDNVAVGPSGIVNSANGETDTYAAIEDFNIYGDDGNDTLDLGAQSGSLSGDAGNDTLTGGPSSDFLDGGDGDNTMNGGDGADTLFSGPGDDHLNGGAGDDSLSTQGGADVVDGGAGDDALSTEGTDGSDNIVATAASLPNTAGPTTTYSGVETLDLSLGDGNDVVDLSNSSFATTVVSGDLGNDTITGTAGSDTIYGGDGNDVLLGGNGDDSLSGDDGDDSLVGGDGMDSLYGGFGTDQFDAGPGDDYVDSEDYWTETVNCGAGTDNVFADNDDSFAADCEPDNVTQEGLPPDNVDSPTITGDQWKGAVLTAHHGTWLYNQAHSPTFAFAWQRCNADFSTCADTGVTAPTYVLGPDDVGKRITVVETATDDGRSSSAWSIETGVIQNGPPPPPPSAPPPPPPPPPPSPPPPPASPPAPPPAPKPKPKPKPNPKPVKKVLMCHKGHTIKVPKSQVKKHRKHGDKLRACKKPRKRHR